MFPHFASCQTPVTFNPEGSEHELSHAFPSLSTLWPYAGKLTNIVAIMTPRIQTISARRIRFSLSAAFATTLLRCYKLLRREVRLRNGYLTVHVLGCALASSC